MKSLPGNPFDGHTLKAAIGQVISLTGVSLKQAYVDRGYKGHGINNGALESLKVWIAVTQRGITRAINRKHKRRSAIEPVIGHLKSDGRLSENFLKGEEGDAMNAILCAAGHNIRKILRQLALFIALCLIAWRPYWRNSQSALRSFAFASACELLNHTSTRESDFLRGDKIHVLSNSNAKEAWYF